MRTSHDRGRSPHIIDTDDFKTLRRYTRKEAAAVLHINERWLKEWVTEKVVPHQRKGTMRGVWFTYDNIREIGVMLPDLMNPRKANERARVPLAGGDHAIVADGTNLETPDEQHSSADPAVASGRARPAAASPATLGDADELIAKFSGLRAVRPRR